MSSELAVRALSLEDLPRNVALSNAVGWSDSPAEWRVIYQAALVLAVEHENQLVAQGALGLFDGAGSIAKMVVAPSARKRGLGARVLMALLAEAERRSLTCIGLVATPAGQRLYEQHGFTPEGEVVILAGTPTLSGEPSSTGTVADVEQLFTIERRFTGSARTNVLRGRLVDSHASAILDGGFALSTLQPNGARVGPIFADSERTARILTRDLLLRAPGPVRFDVPGEQRGFRSWLLGLGLVEKGVHLEMSRGGRPPWRVPQRYGQATQAWG